jgi:hypothetical protein
MWGAGEDKTIYTGNNPGSSDCDRTIAAAKGWTIAEGGIKI